MRPLMIVLLLSLLIGCCQVFSFSLGRRDERSTDLAEALAILQRQRRRAVAEYLSSDRVFNNNRFPLGADWLRKPSLDDRVDDQDLDLDWDRNGNFLDLEPLAEIALPAETTREPEVDTVEPSKQELENIFEDDDVDGNISDATLTADVPPEKKKLEEMINIKGDGKIVQKKSTPPITVADALAASSNKEENPNDGLSLEKLTKEEINALMKAVRKLEKQASKFSEKTVETPQGKVTTVEAVEKNGKPQEITIVQPASKEELKAVFEEEEAPSVKETNIVVEREPNSSGERIIEQRLITNASPKKVKELKAKELELVNEIASELESNIEAEKEALEAESLSSLGDFSESRNGYLDVPDLDWPVRSYPSAPQKRTTKRSAVITPHRIKYLETDADRPGSLNDELDTDLNPANLEQLVGKILQLQDEVDNLKIVSRLEDLENDVLTDALNEATMAQKEGSVTDMEFDSLQQAIQIEEALQKLKGSLSGQRHSSVSIKRGEPWRRKRDPSLDRHEEVEEDMEPTSWRHIPSELELTASADDLDRILGPSNLRDEDDLEDDDEDLDTEPTTGVASFFMSSAEDCPAVREYSTNCQLADLYSLPVDFEARSLCNLHEMCYSCGNSLHVGQDQCDLVYRASASALCRGQQKCVLESEIFLRTMKLKTRYIPHHQPLCRSSCVAEFLGML